MVILQFFLNCRQIGQLALLFLPYIPFLKPDLCLVFPCVFLSAGSAPPFFLLTKGSQTRKLNVNWYLII